MCVYFLASVLTAAQEQLMRILQRRLISKNTKSAIVLVWTVNRYKAGMCRGKEKKKKKGRRGDPDSVKADTYI